MRVGMGVGIGAARRAAIIPAANPLQTIGAETLVGAGGRNIGAANGVYGPYTVAGGLMSPNTTPVTPGTYNVGGYEVVALANTKDVGAGELAAVVALGSSGLDGKTIRVLPGADANAAGSAGVQTFGTGLVLPTGLTITSVDTANDGYLHRMILKQNGIINFTSITIKDDWAANDTTATALVDLDTNSGASNICEVNFSKCLIRSSTPTVAEMAPAATTAVTIGFAYTIATVAAGNWSSIGGPAAAVAGDIFTATSTNANITALGSVYLRPHTIRLLSMSAKGTNQTRDVMLADCYLHSGWYGIVHLGCKDFDIQRCRLDWFVTDAIQCNPVGTETTLKINDNWFQGVAGAFDNPFGTHNDAIQINTTAMTQVNATAFEVIGNRFFGKNSNGPYQGIFIKSTGGTFRTKALVKHNMLLTAFTQGICLTEPDNASEVSHNTICFDQKFSVNGDVPKFVITNELNSHGAVFRDNLHSGLGFIQADAPVTWGKTVNNLAFPTNNNAGMDDYLTGTDFNSDNIPDLAAFTAAMVIRSGSAADTASPKIGAHYYSHGAAPSGSKSGLGAGTSSVPASAAPNAFTAGMWTLADAGGGLGLNVTIISLPSDNGAQISDIKYRINGGAWVSSGGIVSFTILSGLTMGVSANIELQAINSVGDSAASDLKAETPTNTYAIVPAQFDNAEKLEATSGLTLTGSKMAIIAFNLFAPTTWPTSNAFVGVGSGANTDRMRVSGSSSGRMNFFFADSAGTQIASVSTATTTFVADTWYGVVMAIDTTTGVQRLRVYIRTNGGAWTSVINSTTMTADAVIGSCTRGIVHDTTGALYLADLYVNMGEWLDLSVGSNLDKFLPATNKGATGATPTGAQPELFFSGAIGSWHTNKGAAGSLTLTGTLSTAPSGPT